MYKVKAISLQDVAVVVACGTDWQAMDKMAELAARGFKTVTVTDPAGKEWTQADFERLLDE